MWRTLLPMLAACSIGTRLALADAPRREDFLLVDTSRRELVTGLQYLGGNLARVGAPAGSKRAAFLEASSFEKWKTFEDEHVKFDYPDYPGMTVEVVSAANPKPVPVYGSPVRLGPRPFALIYLVKLDELVWASFSFQKADDLGFLGCLCGEVVVRTTIPRDGYVYAYSLMSTGELKYMQVLGDGWRIDLSEWTHSPITQGMYLQLAESVRLKHPTTRTDQEWRDLILNDSPVDYARLGWLRPEMKVDDVLALLGSPTRQSDTALEYERISEVSRWKQTIRVPLREGAFRGFDTDCWKNEEIPPERGSLGWATELARRFYNMEEPERKKAGKEIKRDGPFALESFLQNAPEAKEREWADWCYVVTRLAEIGMRDARVIPIIQQKFLSMDSTMADAAVILKQYEVPERDKLYLERLRTLQAAAADSPNNERLGWSGSDYYYLLDSLSSPKARIPFVREGLPHPDDDIRGSAMLFLKVLPTDEAHLAARRGITDTNERVRNGAARALAERLATAGDIPLLEARLLQEGDKYVREQLEKALARSTRR